MTLNIVGRRLEYRLQPEQFRRRVIPAASRYSKHRLLQVRDAQASHLTQVIQSCRKATTGSTFVARRAGTKQAAAATTPSTTATPRNETGSIVLAWNNSNWLPSNRAAPRPARIPTRSPTPTSLPPARKIR